MTEALFGPEAVEAKDEFALLDELARVTGQPVPRGLQGLEKKPVLHDRTIDPEGMAKTVREILGL